MSNSDTPHTVPLEWMREETIREWMKSEFFPNESVQVPIDEGGTEGYFISEIISRYVASHSPGWVKIEDGKPETLPPPEIDVYLWANHGWPTVGKRRIFSNRSWVFDNHANFPTACFTHWMLPASPSEGETRK